MRTRRLGIILVSVACLHGPAAGGGQPVTVDGITFVDRGVTGEIASGPLRGGMAVLDYDADGFPDLFVSDDAGEPNRLFHNVPDAANPGNRSFVDATTGSGLDDAEGTARLSLGVVAGDYDNDGDPDLFLTGAAGTSSYGLLYRNDGGTFTNVSAAAGVRRSGDPPWAASWTDFDLDGRLDLFMVRPDPEGLFVLLRNQGDGTFADASERVAPVEPFGVSYSHLWTDFDGDGYADCFVLTGSDNTVLLHNIAAADGGRMLVDVAAERGFTELGFAPMGLAAGDWDSDGDLDISVSNGNIGRYYRNDGQAVTRVFPFNSIWGWGNDWLDIDNDGDLDWYMAGSYPFANVDQLFRNLGDGRFDSVNVALNTDAYVSQYCVQLDYNNDGRQDLITLNHDGPVDAFLSFYENRSTTQNHWIMLRLAGDGERVNREAVGAVARLIAGGRTQVREIINGSSTSSTEDLRAHFGLAAAAAVDRIEVVWPRRGSLVARTDVFTGPWGADQIVTLSPRPAGDLNCDGQVGMNDVPNLVLALVDPAGFAAASPDCNIHLGDLNGDQLIDGADVQAWLGSL